MPKVDAQSFQQALEQHQRRKAALAAALGPPAGPRECFYEEDRRRWVKLHVEHELSLRVLYQHDVTIRRIAMQDHEPSYLVGLSFNDHSPEAEATIADLLERISVLSNGVDDATTDADVGQGTRAGEGNSGPHAEGGLA